MDAASGDSAESLKLNSHVDRDDDVLVMYPKLNLKSALTLHRFVKASLLRKVFDGDELEAIPSKMPAEPVQEPAAPLLVPHCSSYAVAVLEQLVADVRGYVSICASLCTACPVQMLAEGTTCTLLGRQLAEGKEARTTRMSDPLGSMLSRGCNEVVSAMSAVSRSWQITM